MPGLIILSSYYDTGPLLLVFCFYFFINHHLRIYSLKFERERDRDRQTDIDVTKKETSVLERIIDWLLPVCTLTGSQTCDLFGAWE